MENRTNVKSEISVDIKDELYPLWEGGVSFKDKERALSGESWPEGWGVRRFNGSIRDDQKSAAPFQPQGTTAASPPGAAPPATSS